MKRARMSKNDGERNNCRQAYDKLKNDPVNKRIFSLFGLDCYSFLERLAKNYRDHAEALAKRSAEISSQIKLLTPDEFEKIVRFQPLLIERFNNIPLLPGLENLYWEPKLPIPYYMPAEDVEWKNEASGGAISPKSEPEFQYKENPTVSPNHIVSYQSDSE